MFISLQTEFDVFTYLAEREAIFNRQHGDIMNGDTSPVLSRWDSQFLKPVLDISKNVHQGHVFSSEGC